TITALMSDLYHPVGDHALLPASQNFFIAQKVLEAMHGPFRFDDAKAKGQLEKLVAAEALSFSAAGTLRPDVGVFDDFFQTDLDRKPVYGLRHRIQSSTMLALLSDIGLASVL